jgi:hypothetical protein
MRNNPANATGSLQGGSAAQVADIPDTASRQRPGRAAIQRPGMRSARSGLFALPFVANGFRPLR